MIAKAYTLFCELHIRANISAGTNITHSPRRPCARDAGRAAYLLLVIRRRLLLLVALAAELAEVQRLDGVDRNGIPTPLTLRPTQTLTTLPLLQPSR